MTRSHEDNRILTPNPLMTGVEPLPKGYSYRRERLLPYWLLVVTCGGKAEMGGNGWRVPMSKGDVYLIEPNASMNQDALSTWDRIWVLFEPRAHWESLLRWPTVGSKGPGGAGYRQLRVEDIYRKSNPIRKALVRMHDLARSEMANSDMWAMLALEEALLLLDEHNPQSLTSQLHPAVSEAEQFIARNLAEPITVDDVADAAGVSAVHLSRLFRDQLSTSVQTAIERRRMEHAMRELQLTALPISQIAEQVGFADPFYFSTRFRKYTGSSPRAFRQLVTDHV